MSDNVRAEVIQDLLRRLTEATGPDADLDHAIADTLGLDVDKVAAFSPVSRFTGSIDDALKVVPEGWTRDVDATAPWMGVDVELFAPAGGAPDRIKGSHEIEAIATCIAGIRARELNQTPRGK